MYSNIEELKKAYSQGKKLKYVFFWGHQPQKDGSIGSSCLSQWWPSLFTVNDTVYYNAEHWMMAEKARLFNDTAILKRIIQSKSPAQVKKLGREIKGFIHEIWDEKKLDIVVQGNYHKFTQNQDIKEYLILTKNKIIVEASPVDKIWGIGLAQDNPDVYNPLKWKGLNLLGFALMKVRENF